MPFGLKDIEINRLKQLFAADERIETVILYGSRAKGTHKPFSDVDITLTGNDLTHENLVRLSLAIDDLLLPYQFDISILSSIENKALMSQILATGITIYRK
ncbi:MAG TPA: nucleotidyltransferase domain-containing protein [Candidatus Coprenecus pullistercoris]|nr:nucleotidyltransferase domain-containing protein [Candidatus Coprenecus pullistercoris]